MRASTGVYYPRLDHIRALAAFLVFTWHVTQTGTMVQRAPEPFVLSLFDEGWIGVDAFMTLSGYLFAKIVGEKDLRYGAFLWNRFIRLVPLLAVVTAYYMIFQGYQWISLLEGFYTISWPSTAWSIAVELHFYIIFPLLLFFQRKVGTWSLLAVLAVSIGLRAWLWHANGQVQEQGYWTLIGHFDQFVFGMVFQRVAQTEFCKRFGTWIFLVAMTGLMFVWQEVDKAGGFYHLGGAYPSPSPLWIILPTISGLFWGGIIAGYDNSRFPIPAFIDKPLALVGTVSYSIYLIHKPILVFFLTKVIAFPADFGLAMLLSVGLFVPIVLICTATYYGIEKPFLRFRMKYVKDPASRRSPPSAEPEPVAD